MTDVSRMQAVSGVVLDGGRGTRMGGVNKGLVQYRGRPLFEYAVANLKPHVTRVLINTNTDKAHFTRLGYGVFDDGSYVCQGPLAGIYAALCHVRSHHPETSLVATASCDQLLMPEHVYPELISRARVMGGAYAVGNDSFHPTCAVLSLDHEDSLRQSLEAGELRLGAWMKRHASAVTFPDVAFANVNRLPEAWGTSE